MTGTIALTNLGNIANALFNSVTANSTAITALSVGGATINSTAFAGTVNNAINLGGIAAASYQLNSTLAANVAGLTANNTSFVGTVSAANVVSNAQLSANLSNYQTTAGLSANVATLTANNASFLGGTAAASYQLNSTLAANVATLSANNSTNLNGQPASFYTNATNISTGTLPDARLSSAVVNTSAAFTLGGNITLSANLTIASTGELIIANGAGIFANGSLGTAGQSLTSNGTGVYWGAGGVNTAAQFSWTNTHSFSANLTILDSSELIIQPGAGINANGSFGSAGQVLTSDGSSVYWAPAAAGTNTAAAYAWTNTHSFSSNVTFTGTVINQANAQTQTLSDSTGTINWNVASGQVATVTLTGTGRTVAAPTNLKVGTYILHILQDATGGRTITSWNSVFKWSGGAAWAASNTSPNARDVLSFISDGTNLYGTWIPDVR